MTDKPIFQSQRRHSLDEDIPNGTFDPSQMEDTSESLIDQIEDADEAAELNQQLQEALKEGPVMVMTADGREKEVHVPSQWEGKLSGMPFSIQTTPSGQMMVFSIPHTFPITLAVSVKDEFSLLETAVSTDMGLAMAARPEDFSDAFKKQEEMRLTWFLGFLRTSLSRTKALNGRSRRRHWGYDDDQRRRPSLCSKNALKPYCPHSTGCVLVSAMP